MRKAFSLIELSISLLIIALIIALVSSGSKLLHNYKIQKSTAEIVMMDSAVKSFKSIYEQLPGDISTAADYWGRDCAYTVSGTDYCSGDGDSQIEATNGNSIREASNALMHLAIVKLIPDQNFTLNTDYLSYDSAGFETGKMRLYYTANGASEGFNYISGNEGNLIQLGGSLYTDDALFIPLDQYRIDLKLDDGEPRTGKITYRDFDGIGSGPISSAAACTNTSTSYYLSSKALGCNIVYELDEQ